jgi:hypothetical protein
MDQFRALKVGIPRVSLAHLLIGHASIEHHKQCDGKRPVICERGIVNKALLNFRGFKSN